MALTAKEKNLGITESKGDIVIDRKKYIDEQGGIKQGSLSKRDKTILKNIEASKMIEAHNKLRNFDDNKNVMADLEEVRKTIREGTISNEYVLKALKEKIKVMIERIDELEAKKAQQDDFLIAGEENQLKLYRAEKSNLEAQKEEILSKTKE
jgi:hypothetical protein